MTNLNGVKDDGSATGGLGELRAAADPGADGEDCIGFEDVGENYNMKESDDQADIKVADNRDGLAGAGSSNVSRN